MKVLFIVFVVLVLSFAVMSCSSRRPQNLGVKNAALSPLASSPNGVSTFADSNDAEHYISPEPFLDSLARTKADLKALLAKSPRTDLISETDNYLHYECRSLIFRFVDDLEIYLDEEGKLIHFRSASRVGHSDFGVNRKRVEKIKLEWQSLGK